MLHNTDVLQGIVMTYDPDPSAAAVLLNGRKAQCCATFPDPSDPRPRGRGSAPDPGQGGVESRTRPVRKWREATIERKIKTCGYGDDLG